MGSFAGSDQGFIGCRRRRRNKKDNPKEDPETPIRATPCQAGLISALATLGSWLGQAQNPAPFAPQLPCSFPAQKHLLENPGASGGHGIRMVPVGGEGVASGGAMPTPVSQGGASGLGTQPMQIQGIGKMERNGGSYSQMMGRQVGRLCRL